MIILSVIENIVPGQPRNPMIWHGYWNLCRRIINAVMNCSFLQNSRIQVAIYDDRLEITSPGGLMPGVTLDKMKEGYSKIRNRALAHAFSYMNLIEAWGSGIPKLLESMQEYGLREPEFCDLEIGFRINLYRKTEDKKSETTQVELIAGDEPDRKHSENEKELRRSQKGAEKEPKRSRKMELKLETVSYNVCGRTQQ